MAAIKTGHTSTITFPTSSFTASFISIGSFTQAREVLDDSHLGTTVMRTKQPGDLVDPGEFTCEFFFDADDEPPISAAAEAVVVTLPNPGTSGANVSGSAFISSWDSPELVTDDLMKASLTVSWAGLTTWADEVS